MDSSQPTGAATDPRPTEQRSRWTKRAATVAGPSLVALLLLSAVLQHRPAAPADESTASPATQRPAFSVISPTKLGFEPVARPADSRPNEHVWAAFADAPKPTNAWWENLALGKGGDAEAGLENQAFALPYIVDVAHPSLTGLRATLGRVVTRKMLNRYCQVVDCDNVEGENMYLPANFSVATDYNLYFGVTLSTTQAVQHHRITSHGKLAVTLEWQQEQEPQEEEAAVAMRSSLVYGSAYFSMEYPHGGPVLIHADQTLLGELLVDGKAQPCDGTSFTIDREVEFGLGFSDEAYIVFVSRPMAVRCDVNTTTLSFDIAGAPLHDSTSAVMVRAARVNNCTGGFSDDCLRHGTPNDDVAQRDMLRDHATVFPSGYASVSYEVLAQDNDTAALTFDFAPKHTNELFAAKSNAKQSQSSALLMYALPQHMEGLRRAAATEALSAASSAAPRAALPFVVGHGLCLPTVRGEICPVVAPEGVWKQHLKLSPVRFTASNAIGSAFVNDLNQALDKDLEYDLPLEFRLAAGSTYVGGKMLAKMGRIALIAQEVGREEEAMAMAERLYHRLSVWLHPTALSPLLFDPAWGGLVSCGCYWDESETKCGNDVGPSCPGFINFGENFGHAFYQDHHFHFGYHIYAAAVVAHFLPHKAIRQFPQVVALARDIANPSHTDSHFPTWRHKDWFVGSSWASGIVPTKWGPDQNGRNQESISEAVNAYDALALYGAEMHRVFGRVGDLAGQETSQNIRDTGRLLLSTELTAARLYWQVCEEDCGRGTERVYPEDYAPKVVGQVWSDSAQMQTWFGSSWWKVFGIQLMPQTAVSEDLWNPTWIAQMLPAFARSCDNDPTDCKLQGWSTLQWGAAAVLGGCLTAREHVLDLPDSVYATDGGNGQSKSNALWWIATRCAGP